MNVVDAFVVVKVARAMRMGGATTPQMVGKIGAKAGVTSEHAVKVLMDAGWPSLQAVESVELSLREHMGGWPASGKKTRTKVVEKMVEVPVEKVVEKVVEVPVPVELATNYLDHPSPLVQAVARLIADDYRRLERHVELWERTHQQAPEPAEPEPAEPEPVAEPVTPPVVSATDLAGEYTKRVCRTWTAEDDAIVLDPNLSGVDAAKRLGINANAVYQRRHVLRKTQGVAA